MDKGPDLRAMKKARDFLAGKIIKTPVLELSSTKIKDLLPLEANVRMKLELFQQTGSFKSRGALLALSKLTKSQKEKGVIAVSAGNHALAVSWAAMCAKTNAKVVMLESSDPVRIEGCRNFGAEVILSPDAGNAFSLVEEIAKSEGRAILKPFDSEEMILGSASCGLEIIEDFPELEVAIVPVGGGGLISGIAAAIKRSNPSTVIYGIEPEGADSMYQSFQTHNATKLEKVDTIADSLGSPMTMKYSLGVAQSFVDAIVRVRDEDLISAMILMRDKLNLMVEPACAASLAGLLGPLKEMVSKKHVSVIACGSYISFERYQKLVQ